MERIEYKKFFIDKTKTGYRVSKQSDTYIHTHLHNLNPCYKLINNITNKRIPTRCSLYYVDFQIKLLDGEHKSKLEDYYEVKLNKGKKQRFYNPHKKRF